MTGMFATDTESKIEALVRANDSITEWVHNIKEQVQVNTTSIETNPKMEVMQQLSLKALLVPWQRQWLPLLKAAKI